MQRIKKSLAWACCALVLLAATGCASPLVPGLYRMDIRQGNYIDQAMVAQLQPGMTRQQVQFLLGTPLIDDPFHQHRWDYVYFFQPGDGEVERRHIALFFEGDILARMEGGGDLQPPIQ